MSTNVGSFPGGAVLSTRFTGTLSQRNGEPVELLESPDHLAVWLRDNGFAVKSITMAQLARTRRIREAIHTAALARALENALPAGPLRTINRAAGGGQARPMLTSDGTLVWRLRGPSPLDDALGVIADDAISLIAGEHSGTLAICSAPTCRAVFLDASRAHTRRWCDMNTCGNRNKKARFHARHGNESDAARSQ